MKRDVVIAGVGGQGNIFASGVLSRLAMKRGYTILGTETIGAAQRGGSVVSHIRISEGQIFSPLVPRGQADVLLGFEPLEMLRHIERLNPKGKYLLNMYKIPTVMCNMGLDRYPEDEEIQSSLIQSGVKGLVIPATQRAFEIGNIILTNVIMLGALSAFDPFFVAEDMKEIITTLLPENSHSMNMSAFDEGMSLVESQGRLTN